MTQNPLRRFFFICIPLVLMVGGRGLEPRTSCL
jgi:hypothetical protein